MVVAAVAEETVAAFVEAEFLHEALHGCHEVYQEIGVAGLERHHAADLALGYDEDVQRIAGLGVIKRQQQIGLAQTINGDDKAHMGE